MRADTTDVMQLWIDIEDHLIPFLQLDAHLRAVYYHLVRRSRLLGQRRVEISIDSLAKATGLSTQVRQHIRTLETKGAIKILSRGRTGTTIEVYTPSEIPDCIKTKSSTEPFDIETYDFYTTPFGRRAIIERDGGQCFYCLRGINSDSAVWTMRSDD
jgi:biotin operon repressor